MAFTIIDGVEHGSTTTSPLGVYGPGAGVVAISTTTVRAGSRSLDLSAGGYRGHEMTGRVVAAGIGVQFQGFPVGGNNQQALLDFTNANGALAVGYNRLTGKFCVFSITGSLVQDFGPASLSTGVWYWLDVSVDTTVNPAVIKARVTPEGGGWDGTEGTVSPAQAAADCTQVLYGNASTNFARFCDDFVLSHAASGVLSEPYPIGPRYIEGLYPTGDGTHNINAADELERSATGTDITNATTDAYTLIDDVELEISTADASRDYIRDIGTATADYVEVTFADLAAGSRTPVDVKGYATDRDGGSLGTNSAVSRIVLADGTAVTPDLRTAADDPGTTLAIRMKMLDRPTGGWDRTKVNGMRGRLGFGDGAPEARFFAMMLEVVLVPPPIVLVPGAASGSPVVWPFAQKGWRKVPDVYFTIDGVPVDVDEDWSLRSSAYGGYETGSFKIKARDVRAHPFGISQGAPVAVYTQGDLQIWEGTLPVSPNLGEDGRAEISTVGPWAEAEAASEVRCFQVRGAKEWVEADSDPHNYNFNDGFMLNHAGGKLEFRAPKGEDFTTADVAGFLIWVPGAHFTRTALVMNKSGDHANFELRLRGAQGPSGSFTTIDSYTWGAANPTGTEKIATGLGGDYDLITAQIHCTSTVSNLATRLRTWLTSLRVNDLAADDDMSASDVVTHTGEALGWNVDGVQSTAANVLPLLWTEQWSELLIYMADLEDHFVRRIARGLEYAPWGDQSWEVLRSYSARPELKPLEAFNRAVIRYETVAGAPAEVSVDADPDPLPGQLKVIDYDLSDPQPNSTLANAVAERMIGRYSLPRWAGRVEVYRSRHQAGPLAILPGDVIDVADWDMGVSQPLRVHGAEYRKDHATLAIESPISLVQLIEAAQRGFGHPKRRGKNKRK
jgi:hypothetical protein